MRATLRQIDDPHDAPIAPDVVPAEWADPQVARPADEAASREKLFAEICHAAEVAAPQVDTSFRASDVNDIPALKKKSSPAWAKSAVTAFAFALLSAFAAAAWKHHGEAAIEILASWMPLPAASSAPATEPPTESNAQLVAKVPTAQPEAASSNAALPPEAEQQIQSMARDLAAMGRQVEQLKATIETLKANQQAAAIPAAPPVARPTAPAPKPKVAAAPRPLAPPPVALSTRAAYPPTMQAAAIPPATAPPPGYQPPPQPYPSSQAYPPSQAATQPNGEPVVRPPMPMPLLERY